MLATRQIAVLPMATLGGGDTNGFAFENARSWLKQKFLYAWNPI